MDVDDVPDFIEVDKLQELVRAAAPHCVAAKGALTRMEGALMQGINAADIAKIKAG